MDIKSIRIGNILQGGVRTNTPARVIEIKEEKVIAKTENNILFEQVSPYPLTEDYLRKIGFTQSGNNLLRIYKKACIRIEVQEATRKTAQKEVTQFTIKLEDSSRWKKIIFGIHELQNYYYDHTGQEVDQ